MKDTLKPMPKYEHELSIQSINDDPLGNKNYWLNSFTEAAWEEFISSGGYVTGFKEKRWKTVEKIKYGDYFLCYVSGISGFISILKVISKPYFDKNSLISKMDLFPARISVDVIVKLKAENAVPLLELKDQLSIFNDPENQKSWNMLLRDSPKLLRKEDGALIAKSITQRKFL